jgi:hypothetical protein
MSVAESSENFATCRSVDSCVNEYGHFVGRWMVQCHRN